MEYPCYRVYEFDDGTNVLQARVLYSEEERTEFIKKNDDYIKIDSILLQNVKK